MKDRIELFATLGRRLADFGGDAYTSEVIKKSCAANGWFTAADISRAVTSIAQDMLRPDLLEKWLAHYPVPVVLPRRVLVVMAGNIPLVGFFDLLCVLASGHRCLVKPSAKDGILMEYMVNVLREIDPKTPVEFYDGHTRVDAVIATGSDNANRYFRAQYAGIPTLLRGNRQSVAVLAGNETEEQLTGLADDIWAYSGLGCRSVSLLFLPEGYDLRLQMPAMNQKYRNNYLQQKAILTMTGRPFHDFGAAVGVEQRAFPAALSCISYSYYKMLAEVETWLAEHDSGLQCVVSETVKHNRRTGFGHAQSPALTDYPDDRDVIAFLTTLD